MAERINLYQIVTDKIIESLKKGNIVWSKGWKDETSAHFNGFSKTYYRGVNKLILNCEERKFPIWLTFKQVKNLRGSIKKGSSAVMLMFYLDSDSDSITQNKVKPPILEEDEIIDGNSGGALSGYSMLKYYNVFNIDDCELPDSTIKRIFKYIVAKEEIDLKSYGNFEDIYNKYPNPKPRLRYKETDRCFYSPSSDFINMVRPEWFKNINEYYSTLFHELIHSTGHPKRLQRMNFKEHSKFGSNSYANEELVAEIGAAFLCSLVGIELNIDNHTAYIQSWLRALQNDNKLIFYASSKAQQAVDFILGVKF